MDYYLLRQDLAVLDKWILGDIRHVDNWKFSDPPDSFMEPAAYVLDVRFDGVELDYTLAGYASAPVLSRKAKDSLVGLPEVDEPYKNVVFESVVIEGKKTSGSYYIMIVESQADCVDETKSKFEVYTTEDPVRPDLAGCYRVFYNLVIDGSRVGGKHIFRLKNYLGALVVSSEMKSRFEQAGVVGAIFESVNGDRVTVA